MSDRLWLTRAGGSSDLCGLCKTFLVVPVVFAIAAIRLAADAGALGILGWLPCRTSYEQRLVANELVTIAENQYDEIDSLLKTLIPVETHKGTMTVFEGPHGSTCITACSKSPEKAMNPDHE